jgi:predicted lysophospholipase L1 biosynthesis ABC-type transport system permease subunit
VSVYSTRELMVEMDRRLLYFRQLATILGSIALVVTALLVSTIVTIGVRERFGEIATLRAIGVARGRILLAVVAEGLLAGLPRRAGRAPARPVDGRAGWTASSSPSPASPRG